ncbi:MAG: DUF3800 domain-containing protein [Anaerolineales bacterium]|nr:DUF3800 domain-containing protein [Anaerolineales bacterium]
MLTFTFAGDEAGDASLNFGKGASRYLVLTLVATQDADGLRSVLSRLRKREGLAENFEFRFNNLASSKLLGKAMSALQSAEFMAWALVVDKTTLPKIAQDIWGTGLYFYFLVDLVNRIPVEYRNKGTLILDEIGSASAELVKLKRTFKMHGIRHEFSRIFIRRSRSEDLIQVADLVAGSILRRDARKDSEQFDLISDKMQSIYNYEYKD